MGFNSIMNKTHFLCLLISTLLISCVDSSTKSQFESSGKLNTLSVIIDDDLWNGEVGDSIRNKFASPVLGLPYEEPLFSINQYPVKLLEGFMNNSRNIIIVKKQNKSQFSIEESETANKQIIARFSARTVQELLDSIQKNSSLLVQKIKRSEIDLFQKFIKTQPLTSTKELKNKFSISLSIPSRYKLMLTGNKFVWYKKEITSGNLSLLCYQIPIKSVTDNESVTARITKIRDSIGSLYIHGAVPKTKMITEPAFAPYLSKTEIYGKLAFETKGNWELTHDFMAGPFINYAIIDNANQRILVLEGFCYAPSKQKRDLLFELEAIIKSIIFLKKK